MLKKFLGAFWPVGLLALLVFIFFWKFFLEGLIPIPADFIVGVYYPWLDYKWGYPAGVPVKNPLLADIPSFIYPIKSFVIDQIKLGIFPLWNPLQFGGHPLFANFQSGVLNPTNLLYLFLPKAQAWAWQTMLQPFLISISTFLFLRHLKVTKFAALFGSLVFSFSGFAIVWLEYNTHDYVVALVPIILLCTDKLLGRRKLFWGSILSFSLALQIFFGYPQLTLYTLMLSSAFLWVRSELKLFEFKLLKCYLIFLFFILIGLALSAVQLLPGWELLSLSQRVNEGVSGGESVAFLPWVQLINLLAPDFFGNPTTYNLWGPGNYTNGVGYSGLIPLGLSLIAVYKVRSRLAYFFTFVGAISIFLALPTIFNIINQLGFLGLKAATATRILVLTNFAVAMLSSFSIDYFERSKDFRGIVKISVFPTLVILSVGLGVVIAWYLVSAAWKEMVENPGRDLIFSWVTNLRVSLRNLLLPFSLSVIFNVLLFLLKINKLKFLIIVCLFLLTVFELFRYGWKYTPFSEERLIFPQTGVLEFLQNQPKPNRVLTSDVIPPSMWMSYGLESPAGYDAVYPKRWWEFLSLLNGGYLDSPPSRIGIINKYDSPLLDLTNVCYVLSLKSKKEAIPNRVEEQPLYVRFEKYRKVYEDGSVEVLRNESCFPRAFLASSYRVSSNPRTVAELMTMPDFSLRETLILEEKPSVRIEVASDLTKSSKVAWIKYQSNGYQLETESTHDGLLFVGDTYFPGWKAYVDSVETRIFQTDYVFRSVFVPAGKHKVDFIYSPESFRIGIVVSVLALVSVFSILVYGSRKKFS